MKRFIHVAVFSLFLVLTVKAQGLDSPVLSEPPDVDIVVSPTVTLEWNSVTGAISYEVQISLFSDFSSLVNPNPVIITTNYYQIPEGVLSSFTVYYWRVKAISSTGSSNYSVAWSFRTAGTPAQEIGALEVVVSNLSANNNLTPNQIQILLQRLDLALHQYNLGHTFVAYINLQLFKLRIYILLYSEFLTPSVANSLIYNANKIISLLWGDSPIAEENLVPKEFDLKQNYPNPFNPSTTIEYTIPENNRVILKIYDVLGKEVATLVDKDQNSGSYIVVWNAQSLSSGIYFYRINAGNYTDTKRMVLKK